MIEKWNKFADKGKTFGVVLIDLLKAFDCLIHDLVIAKVNLRRFRLSALKLLHNYPS